MPPDGPLALAPIPGLKPLSRSDREVRMDKGQKGQSGNGSNGSSAGSAPAGSTQTTQTTQTVRMAAAGDLHCKEGSKGALQPLLQRMAESGDVVVLCGDLTDHGLPAEAK